MKIEHLPLKLAPLSIDQLKISNDLIGIRTKQNYRLKQNDLEILELIKKEHSISEIALLFFKKGIVLSFIDFRKLLFFLSDEDLLITPELKEYFKERVTDDKGVIGSMLEDLDNLFDKWIKPKEQAPDLESQVKNIAFFRSLDENIQKAFFQGIRYVEAPAGIYICRQGQLQRSLFVLIEGEAQVYKKNDKGRTQLVATLSSGSVFGETGFFLGEARTADVITSKNAKIIRIKYDPEIFDNIIKTETAKHLQKRFWAIHALLKSPIFSALPDDCFDSLLFAGQTKNFSPETYICREGESGTTCYLVIQGKLVVSQKGKSIRILDQGDCFGEMALILNQGKRTATVQAQNSVVATEIESRQFYKLMSDNLYLACEFERIALERWKQDKNK